MVFSLSLSLSLSLYINYALLIHTIIVETTLSFDQCGRPTCIFIMLWFDWPLVCMYLCSISNSPIFMYYPVIVVDNEEKSWPTVGCPFHSSAYHIPSSLLWYIHPLIPLSFNVASPFILPKNLWFGFLVTSLNEWVFMDYSSLWWPCQ